MYNGDRQAPPNLLNLLPDEMDLDPDTWLTRHMSILAFLHTIANASSIQGKIFLKESVHIYKILQVLDMNKFPPNIVDSGTWEKLHPSWRSPQLRKILLYLLHHVESFTMYTLFLNGRSFILRLK